MNHALRRISLAVLVMFLALIINDNYVQGFDNARLANSVGNQRTFNSQFQVQRGYIMAGTVTLAKSRPASGLYKFQRYYPPSTAVAFAPITGYDSIFGKTGIEGAENNFLDGSASQLAVRNFLNLISGKPSQGSTVSVTVNPAAQEAAYQALAATGLPSGAVAIKPSTGAILAMASYPSFDPNKYAVVNSAALDKVDHRLQRAKGQPLVNKAINLASAPGSTFKIVTSSAAFQTGRWNPDTVVYAPTNLRLPGAPNPLINFDNLPCGDGSGHQTVLNSFMFSCNTVFGNIGMHLGSPALRRQADAFGFNNPNLRIPLPVSQSAYPLETDPAFTAFSAIGQKSDTVTPLQEAMLSAAISNRGTLMRPYLVQQVQAATSLVPVQLAHPSVLSQAVNGTIASDVQRMMEAVVDNPSGTAHGSAFGHGFPMACKTGTAQNGIHNGGIDNAVISCFSPGNDIAVGVIVVNGGLGNDASGPVAVKIVQAYLHSLGKG